MIQYTTPTITLRVNKYTIPDDAEIYVSLEQGMVSLEIRETDITLTPFEGGTYLRFELTQAQSGQFKWLQPVRIQVNWIDENEKRDATRIAQFPAFENLLDRVISYGG